MSWRFSSETGRAANKKRKRRYAPITEATVSKKKDYKKLKTDTKSIIQGWRANLYSGGSNNSIGFAGLKRVIDEMHRVEPFSRRSVFVDFGCSAGTPSFYVSNRFRCKSIGLDYDGKLIEIAKGLAREFDSAKRCSFEERDFTTLDRDWLKHVGATHVFAFDGVFEVENWTMLFHEIIGSVSGLTGASVSKFRRLNRGRQWPNEMQLIGEPLNGIKLVGGTSSFNFGVWRTVEAL